MSEHTKINVQIPLNWKHLGNVGKAFGVKGDFYLTDGCKAISAKNIFLKAIDKNKCAHILKIQKIRTHKRRHIIKVKNIDTRNQLEKLQGATLLGDSSIYNSFYEKLEGMLVKDINGILVGTIQNFYNFGAGDIVQLKKEDETLQLPLQKTIFEDFDSIAKGNIPNSHWLQLKISQETYEDLWTKNK